MKASYEILILVILSTLLVFTVNNIKGKELKLKARPSAGENNYVQFVTSKPILSMPTSDVHFDGDVYYANDDIPWDWNDSHQQPSKKPALYLADPFINIQPGQFQPMF